MTEFKIKVNVKLLEKLRESVQKVMSTWPDWKKAYRKEPIRP